MERYQLYYWPMLQGRGEYVRLLLEFIGADYEDVARLPEEQGGGVKCILELRAGAAGEPPIYAPPVLKVGDALLSQTSNICLFLAVRHELCPEDEIGRHIANQLQLTIADVVAEAHDTHHPLSTGQYYEDQKEAAKINAAAFVGERMPAYLDYFERALVANGGKFLVGSATSYVDLSMFQTLVGLEYAFPRGYAKVVESTPRLAALRERVAGLPRIAAYLASNRRIPFNEHGIFRHYPELDAPVPASP